MKKVNIIFLVAIFTFVSCLSLNVLFQKVNATSVNYINSKYTVVIDPGHGGADAGTIGIDGTAEKDDNLAIGKMLYEYLNVCGINACLTRDGDYEVYKQNETRNKSDLYNRMDYINSISNSLLISIHQNHFEDQSQWGMQVWYSANTPQSKILADNILDTSKSFLQKDNKRINKQSDNSYYLLYKAKVPSVMVECGFMSNEKENAQLKDSNYQSELAYSIMVGYNKFLSGEK